MEKKSRNPMWLKAEKYLVYVIAAMWMVVFIAKVVEAMDDYPMSLLRIVVFGFLVLLSASIGVWRINKIEVELMALEEGEM